MWSAATAAARWCASRSASSAAARLRPAHGAGGVPLARAARGPQALPGCAPPIGCCSRTLQGLLAVLRPHRRRRGLLLPRAGAGRHHPRQFRLPRPDARGGRLRVRLRIRPRRLLGPARRGRRPLPATAASSSPAMPPTAIRPMAASGSTTGLEDAANLGWKLAARLQGWGSDALLASYSDERRPIFQRDWRRDSSPARIRRRPRLPRTLQSRAATARSSSRPGTRGRARSASARRSSSRTTRASPIVVGPPGGKTSGARPAHVQGAGRASSDAAAAFVRPRRVRGTGPRFHAAGFRRRRRCGARVRAGGAHR